jgi:aspartate dehydrogenase
MSQQLNVGLIGLGAVAGPLVELYLAGGFPGNVRFVGALVQRERQDAPIPAVTTVEALLALEPDYIVEGAGHGAVQSHVGPSMMPCANGYWPRRQRATAS